ncbi:MAG TPA: CDP-diacylglycerol--glycerol-3-phosphate 3-phosphatidyltransferase [Actinomycetota bacterium]|nr:CDP-diacylglycerol--glycerol-3-phosphate 3-phosphatidyltransferase [Actinomycetota bacterium]
MYSNVQATGLQGDAIRERPLTPLGLGWPNTISVLRVLLVPFLVILILARERSASYLAAAIFVVGAATDGLDGYLARRYDSTTRTGIWLDPLADKILVAAPVLTLAALGEFPVWGAAILVARELAISLLRVVLGLRGRSMPASRAAKVKTTLQLLAITLYILPLGDWAKELRLAVLVLALVFTVSTGVLYIVRAMAGDREKAGAPG